VIHVALAAYNEEGNIASLLEGIARVAASSGLAVRVVVTNDGSTDRTRETILSFRGPVEVELLDQPNAGFLKALERSLRRALEKAADDDVCVTMDADDTHPPELIPDLVRKVRAGCDVAIASRFAKGGGMVGVPPHRSVLSAGARVVLGAVLGLPHVRDYSTSYRAFRAGFLREAFRRYPRNLLEGGGFSGMAAFLARLGHLTSRFGEVPLLLRYDRKKGASKMRLWSTLRGYGGVLAGRFTGRFRPE
jgi:dolichol-phosphate mannosyltransferase